MFLPSLSNLPHSTLCSAAGGYIFGKIAGSKPGQWAKIAGIVTLVHDIFFLMIRKPEKDQSMTHSYFLLTSFSANLLHIFALRYVDLISRAGAIILVALATLSLYNRAQEAEKHDISQHSFSSI